MCVWQNLKSIPLSCTPNACNVFAVSHRLSEVCHSSATGRTGASTECNFAPASSKPLSQPRFGGALSWNSGRLGAHPFAIVASDHASIASMCRRHVRRTPAESRRKIVGRAAACHQDGFLVVSGWHVALERRNSGPLKARAKEGHSRLRVFCIEFNGKPQ